MLPDTAMEFPPYVHVTITSLPETWDTVRLLVPEDQVVPTVASRLTVGAVEVSSLFFLQLVPIIAAINNIRMKNFFMGSGFCLISMDFKNTSYSKFS
jgi:hypothetical protein